MNKLLSIIIPSYNMEKYLSNCLDSLIVDDCQLLQQLDVLVVNDGSKDRTSDIGHEYEKRFPEVVRVIDKPNGNYGSCINAALPQARGRFVKILDADDTFDQQGLTEFLRALSALPDGVDFVLSDYNQVEEDGKLYDHISYPFSADTVITPDILAEKECNMQMHAICYRTQHLREIKYVQTEGISYTDTEWIYSPVAHARFGRYVPGVVYLYRLGRAGQTMETKTVIRNRGMLEKIAVSMFRYYDEHHADEGISVPYMIYQLRRIVYMVAHIYTYSISARKADAFFDWLTSVLAKYDFVNPTVDRLNIMGSSRLRFNSLRFSLEHPRLRVPALFLTRVYWAIRMRCRLRK